MAKTTVFTWGYHGWGSAARHFVRAVDALEHERGFDPPVFIDLRFDRGGRAPAFNGKTFGSIVGESRYVWMGDLGNRAVRTKSGARIQIKNPTAAVDLYKKIADLRERQRRVIMFCGCLEPLSKDGAVACHRVEVARLLTVAAAMRGDPVDVVEWPGVPPSTVSIEGSDEQFDAIIRNKVYVPLGSADGELPGPVSLGWGSVVNLNFGPTDDDDCLLLTGPAYVKRHCWALENIPRYLCPGREPDRQFSNARDELIARYDIQRAIGKTPRRGDAAILKPPLN